MENFRKKVKAIDSDIFRKINDLLKENGLEDAEVTRMKISYTNQETNPCPPGKELYCWKDVNGRTYCKCIPKRS